MRAYVIAIDHQLSAGLSERCVQSGARFGVDVEVFHGVMPRDYPRTLFNLDGLPTASFDRNAMAKPEHCMACFLSHRALWQRCADTDEPTLILEHDAVFVSALPELADALVANLGHPSYGPFATPPEGLGPLVSRPAFPGAHAYYVSPEGARKLLAKEREAKSPDMFLCLARFPFLQEWYPWPIVAEDDVSTTQRTEGCGSRLRKVAPFDISKP